MRLDLSQLDRLPAADLDRAARAFERDGYLLLDGLAAEVTPRFRAHLAAAFGLDDARLAPLLERHGPPVELTPQVRARLARIEPSDDLRATLLRVLEPLLLRLVGAFLHVNSTFHGQFKGGPAPVVDHGGYRDAFAEVQGQYLLHQDFTGASLPTSPSAVTLWVPLNDCDEWTLRLYPGSHREGLLCNRWLALDDPRLAALSEPVDLAARAGEGALFHALLLHGSSRPGATRRVSCDMRFFPLCGFLPTPVHVLTERPLEAHRRGLAAAPGDGVRAAFLEALAVLGEPPPTSSGRSALAWVDLIAAVAAGDHAAARAHLERFANRGFGVDAPEAYERFLARPLQAEPLRRLRERLAGLEPDARELAALDRRLESLEAR